MDYYNFDNSSFINLLNKKGFYVADKSISNYPFTRQSLSATLNMNYINFLKNEELIYSKNNKPFIELIQNNQVLNFLTKIGYTYIHISSGYTVTNKNNSANKTFDFGLLTYFQSYLMELTPLRIFSKYLTGEDSRIRIKNTLNYLKNIESDQNNKPLFIFSHILCPRPPFLFTKNGKRKYVPYNANNLKGLGPHYMEQTLFLNKKIELIINSILNVSNNNSIIIIQADHGIPTSIISPSKERYTILNAFYFPDKDYSLLYNEISLVNTWRVILNKFFHQNFELLEDKMYWSAEYPYNFEPFVLK